MKTDKQLKVLRCLENGKYKVDLITGDIYKYYTAIAKWKILKFNSINKYKQYGLYEGRNKGCKVLVYGHIIVYLSKHGIYDENLVIDHKDDNPANNSIENLQLVSKSFNVYKGIIKRDPIRKSNRLRGDDILKLVELYKLHNNYTLVSNITNINRCTIMYLVKKYNNGESLKYLQNML